MTEMPAMHATKDRRQTVDDSNDMTSLRNSNGTTTWQAGSGGK
jgi:hypothetical protein